MVISPPFSLRRTLTQRRWRHKAKLHPRELLIAKPDDEILVPWLLQVSLSMIGYPIRDIYRGYVVGSRAG